MLSLKFPAMNLAKITNNNADFLLNLYAKTLAYKKNKDT